MSIPDTTELTVEDGTLIWRNDDFMISLAEARAISQEISHRLDEVEAVLVDNRNADGTWPSEVNDHWPDLMAEMYDREIACATVSRSMTNAMQINRLSKKAGMDDLIKAFEASDYEEALEFI